MTLDDRIKALDDLAAERLLLQFTGSQPPAIDQVSWSAPLSSQLGNLFNVASGPVAMGGALARAALLVIAQDPEHREGIATLVENPRVEKYALVETALLVSAVLMVLQTHVKFERNKDGQWAVTLEKKPTDSRLLKNLVRKLISFS